MPTEGPGQTEPQWTGEPPKGEAKQEGLFGEWLRATFGEIGWMLCGVVCWVVVCGAGAGLGPITAIAFMIGALPNLLSAVYSVFLIVPVLVLLPFHGLYALALVIAGRRPSYDKGLYAASKWIRKRPLWSPFEAQKKSS